MKSFLTAVLCAGAMCMTALAAAAPKIQFDKTVYDFGKVSQVETISGVFKIKNVGDAVLKIEPPKPSCGCTIAGLKPDTLKPGESGELTFTVNLGNARTVMEKHISVTSNDPLTPEVSLSIKVDYTPLYDVTPMTLAPSLPLGVNVTNDVTTITRTDGKPLHIVKLEPSKPWITAKVVANAKGDASTAQVRVEIQREGLPRRFNESIQIYSAEQSNSPVSTIYLYGQMQGELSLAPETLYWSITDLAKTKAERPEEVVVRRVTIRSATGKAFNVTNIQSSVKGIKVTLVPKESGKVIELVATLNEVPDTTLSGTVSFETSVAGQTKIELPVIVNVFKP